jgi:hypothetical protein
VPAAHPAAKPASASCLVPQDLYTTLKNVYGFEKIKKILKVCLFFIFF